MDEHYSSPMHRMKKRLRVEWHLATAACPTTPAACLAVPPDTPPDTNRNLARHR